MIIEQQLGWLLAEPANVGKLTERWRVWGWVCLGSQRFSAKAGFLAPSLRRCLLGCGADRHSEGPCGGRHSCGSELYVAFLRKGQRSEAPRLGEGETIGNNLVWLNVGAKHRDVWITL